VSGPLTLVLDAFGAGAASLGEVESATGLSRDVVAASVDHLVRMGRLEAAQLSMGCPTGGCGTCASGTADGAAGCGAPAPSGGRRGPALVALTLRRRFVEAGN
jgi:FeoC like transcriptional regulator